MKEQVLQRSIIQYLESQGAWVIKTIATSKRGCPDLVAVIAGRFVAIEVKAPGKLSTVTPIQNHQLKRIVSAGGVAIAVDNLQDVKNCVEALVCSHEQSYS